MDAATEAKTTVENAQRELRATGVKHTTRFFELRDDNCWVPRIQCVFCLIFCVCVCDLLSPAKPFLLLPQASTRSTRGHRRSTSVDMVPTIRGQQRISRRLKHPSACVTGCSSRLCLLHFVVLPCCKDRCYCCCCCCTIFKYCNSIPFHLSKIV